mgnify:CR=1 FL=1
METNTPAPIPGKSAATASMVLGIISVVLWFFGYSAIVSVILGIIGLILGDVLMVLIDPRINFGKKEGGR